MPFLTVATILFSKIGTASALYGYDCVSGTNSIAKLFLNEVGECMIPEEKIENKMVHVQL